MSSGYRALGIDFGTGAFLSFSVSWPDYYVRTVRGQLQASSFIDNGDGTVTDTSTGLMWQQDDLLPRIKLRRSEAVLRQFRPCRVQRLAPADKK